VARHADPHARDALIAAARAEFARRGLRGARVEDITQACHLSKGAFYLHFPTKEALFQELVSRSLAEMEAVSSLRKRLVDRLVAEQGAVERRDVARRTPRYRALLEADQQASLRMLEWLWSFRDVVGVLLTGCQGTPFEGQFWEIAEAEVARIARDFGSEQHQGACRTDVPPELFGGLIVGTYLLLCHRMSRLAEKPDLGLWVWAIQTLIHEGASPAAEPAIPRPAAPQPLDADAFPKRQAASLGQMPRTDEPLSPRRARKRAHLAQPARRSP
jgi:AcrR family transcriptional regulator